MKLWTVALADDPEAKQMGAIVMAHDRDKAKTLGLRELRKQNYKGTVNNVRAKRAKDIERLLGMKKVSA
jgi:hypothetical protein